MTNIAPKRAYEPGQIIQTHSGDSFVELNKPYLFRCMTYHHVGIVHAINEKEIVILKATWVATSARWHQTFLLRKLGEFEVLQQDIPVILSRNAIVDITFFPHEPPKHGEMPALETDENGNK